MEKIMARGLSISTYFYQFFLLNSLFLLTNSLFFQVFFAIDFKPVFFPLYFIVSLTILPSSMAMVRTINEVVFQKNGQVLNSYCQELKKVFRQEKKICFIWTLMLFITISSLYIPLPTNDFGSQFLTALNLLALIGELFLFFMLTSHSIGGRGKEIIIQLISRPYTTLLQSILLLLLGCLLLKTIETVSFTMILFVFSIEYYILVLFWQYFNKKAMKVTMKKESKPYVSSKSRY